MTKDIQKWADSAMFTAEESNAEEGIKIYFLQGTPDPLGSIAAFSAMYTGRVVRNKRDVTDEERRYHLEEMKKTKLKAPLEAVNLHFMVEGVTRSFTHQMVRQRTAVYAQESLRFAVKEDAASAVAIPPSLAGTISKEEWCKANGIRDTDLPVQLLDGFEHEGVRQQMRMMWDEQMLEMSDQYNVLVNMGMPAEDARGMLPHSITTRLNYATNLRNLQDHAGNRLCTQAQFEWRMYWIRCLEAMRNYCTGEACHRDVKHTSALLPDGSPNHAAYGCDNWQWNEIANLFRPVCYLTGKCEFKADFDRKCSIRGRVDANASVGRPSHTWETRYIDDEYANESLVEEEDNGHVHIERGEHGPHTVFIGAISPAEWLLDDGAAR